MLIDDALNDKLAGKYMDKVWLRHCRLSMNTAKRYMFDESASLKLYELARLEAATVCHFAHTAIPPFPNTYIEIDYTVFATSDIALTSPVDGCPADRVGFLFTPEAVFIAAHSNDKNNNYFSPFMYTHDDTINHFVRLDDYFIERDHEELLRYANFLITGLNPLTVDEKGQSIGAKLSKLFHVGICWDLDNHSKEEITEMIALQTVECSGGMRIGIAAILLLNQQRIITTYEKRDSKRRIVHGKVMPSPPYNSVVIDLDAKHQSFHKIFSDGPSHRNRQHDVCRHWSHFECSSQCKHDWHDYRSEKSEKLDIENHGFPLRRQICSLCGGRRTQILEHKRGDPKLGIVKRDYKVTASKHRKET